MKISMNCILFSSIVITILVATTFFRNSIWEADVSLWKDAVAKSRFKTRPHDQLGISYNRRGNPEMAIEQFEIALTLSPEAADVWNNAGLAYHASGRIDEAIEKIRRALQLNPYLITAYNNIGALYDSKGYVDLSIDNYKFYLQYEPNDADGHFNLGIAYGKKKMYAEAIQSFSAALALKPGDREFLHNLRIAEELQENSAIQGNPKPRKTKSKSFTQRNEN